MQNHTLAMLITLALFPFFGSCQSPEVGSFSYKIMLKSLLSHTVPEVSVKETGKNKAKIFFLDAREPHEYAVSHLENAIFVGYDTFDAKKVTESVPKNAQVVVYCSVGYRSEKIAEKLRKEHGFTQVSNLYGGMFEWVNQGYPIVDGQGKPTENVHAFDRTWGVWLKRGKKIYGK